MRAFRVTSSSQFRCLVLTRHRVENPRSGHVVASGTDSAMQQYWLSCQAWALLDIRNNAITHTFRNEQNKLGYYHRTGMAEVAKPIIMANAVYEGCKEAIFRFAIFSFKTQ